MADLTIIQKLPHHHDPQGDHVQVRLLAPRTTIAKRRWRGVAEDGKEFGFDLDEALVHGAHFFVDDDKQYVLEQTPEEVLEIPVTTLEQAARVAWSLGNLHFGVQVLAGAVRVMGDPAVLQLLAREGIAFQRVSCIFYRYPRARITTTTMDIITMDNSVAPEFPWLARLLQVNDSAFPTGGYAHSYGFEQIVRLGLVHDADSMPQHIENHLWPMLIHFELPVVRFAQDAALNDDLAALIELDACVDATKTARELREASRATGRRRMHAFGETGASSTLMAFARTVDEGRSHAHHAVVYGIGLATLPPRALLTSWAFQSLSAVCLSAPKLLRIGQDAAQRVLTTSLSRMEENVTRSLAVSREEIGWFDPFVEITSMQHEIAYERLFIS